MKRLCILFPLIFLLQGCNESQALSPITDAPVDFEILHQDYSNEFGEQTSKSAVVIRNQAGYESELIKRTSAASQAVDFEQEVVLLIDMGRRPTGGYDIDVQVSQLEADTVRATVILSLPGDNCGVTDSETNPYKFIKIASVHEVLISESIIYSIC